MTEKTMKNGNVDNRVRWYRTPIDKETLAQLNTKSDWKGFAQSLGHLGLIALTGSLALYGAGRWPWWAVALIVFVHGTCYSFMINAVHELVHRSVFKTRWLNDFFVRIFGFLGWIHFEHFYTSHMRHHQYTLHPPDDLEVVLPIRLMVKHFFQNGFVNPRGAYYTIKNCIRLARGKFEGEWELKLFPENEMPKRRAVMGWARTLLVGHALLLGISLYCGWWMLPLLITFAPFYGGWLFFLCNNTQHIGLQDDVPDFRLCCRTFTVNPLAQFLYWHMNYHIEHHMYAAVPCYNLARLHRTIEHDLPPCPSGIVATWKEIAAIQRKQVEEPQYQYVAPLPNANYSLRASLHASREEQPQTV
jgi:fatty acid desaturase